MPRPRTPEPNVRYSDDDVRRFPAEHQPNRFEPFLINHPAPGQGQALRRESGLGHRWCPFCQTLLDTSKRKQACDQCAVARSRTPRLSPSQTAQTPPALNPADLERLYDAVEELSQTVALIAAVKASKNPIRMHVVNDLFAASKNVVLATHNIRRSQRDT